MNPNLQILFKAIRSGDAILAKEKVQVILDADLDPTEILTAGMIAATAEVGERFEKEESSYPRRLLRKIGNTTFCCLKERLVGFEIQSLLMDDSNKEIISL